MNRNLDTSVEIDGRSFCVEVEWEDSEFADEMDPPNPQKIAIWEVAQVGDTQLTDAQLQELTRKLTEWTDCSCDRILDGCWFGPKITVEIVRCALYG